MGRKFLVLLGALGFFSPVVLGSFAAVIVMTTLSAIVIVFLALFDQRVLDRLIKLLTAIPSLWERKVRSKKN